MPGSVNWSICGVDGVGDCMHECWCGGVGTWRMGSMGWLDSRGAAEAMNGVLWCLQGDFTGLFI